MVTEGYFTSDEIQSAIAAGAKINNLDFGRISIIFGSDQEYDHWASEQARLHPGRWSHCIRLSPRKLEPTAHS